MGLFFKNIFLFLCLSLIVILVVNAVILMLETILK